MAMANGGPDTAWQEKMARKKKVVNELLALRRMKYMQMKNQSQTRPVHSPTSGRVYEAYNVVANNDPYPNRVTISREKVRDLMKGTMLEKEINEVYGGRAVDDAADHYVNLVSPGGYDGLDSARSNKSLDPMERKLFLNKLLKDRRAKMEAKKEKREEKEKVLLQQKQAISLAKNKLKLDTDGAFNNEDSSDEDIKQLVENVVKSISGMEKNLRVLKQERRTQLTSKRKPLKLPAIDYEFKPWQQEQVKIASSIVEDIIAKTLDLCVYSGEDVGSSMLEALLLTDNEQWQQMMAEGMRHDAMIGIIDELIDEMSNVTARKVSEEVMYLKRMTEVLSADLVINSSFTALYGKTPKASNDSLSKLIDQAWVEMMSRRQKTGQSLWRHTQSVISTQTVSVPMQPSAPVQTVAVQESEGDIVPITYERRPLKCDSLEGEIWERYTDLEYQFWKASSVTLSAGPVSLSYRRIIGISSIAVSGDNMLIALGTFRGDVLVYDITWEPFRPIRCVSYIGKRPDRIVEIAWSLDRARIVTLSETYCVIVWAVAFPSPSSASDIRHLDIPESKDDKFECQQRTALVILEASQGDFAIKEGTLSASLSPGIFASPKTVKFSPVVDMMGAQNTLLIGFASGDILKCDLKSRIRSRFSALLKLPLEPKQGHYVLGEDILSKGNKIASDIEVELLRLHRQPVALIHFVANNGDAISFDESLSVALWKHIKDQLTGFGWFTPFKKFKVSGSELLMSPKGPERLVFEDEITLKKQTKGRKRKGKQVIEQERRDVMMELRTLQIQNRKPWHSDDKNIDDDKKTKTGKFVTRTYAPTNAEIIDPMADQTFHIVTKQKSTNMVVRYALRTYQVTGQKCKALIDFKPNSDGSKIYFMFLYEKRPPNKKAHVTFVDLDLTAFDMLQSSVIKLDMDNEQYERCVTKREASFAVSRRYLFTQTENIFCHLAGRMSIFSVLTGSKIAWSLDKKARRDGQEEEDGLELPAKLGNLTSRLKLGVLCPDGDQTHILMLTHADETRREAIAGMFTLTDHNPSVAKQALTLTNRQLLGTAPLPIGVDTLHTQSDVTENELCVHSQRFSVRHMPTELYMRMTLNSLIDNAVAACTGVRMTKEQRQDLWKRDWKNMQSYFENSAHNGTLD